MPAAPEFGDAFGQIRIVEVFDKMKPEDPAQADGHVGIAGEIEIDLEGKGKGVHPVKQHRRLGAFPEEADQQGEVVRQDDLLAQARQKTPQTQIYILPVRVSVLQFSCHIHIADDGTGNQLGKQGYIGSKGDGIFLSRNGTPVDVDGVAEALEGIEADAHRQGQPQKGNSQAGNSIDTANKEVRVFEKAQQSQTDDHRHRQPEFLSPPLPCPLNGKTAEKEKDNGKNHQKKQFRFAPAVKNQAGDEQNGIFQLPGCKEI